MAVAENGTMLIYVCFLNSVSSCKTVRYHPWDLVPSWNTITMRISHYLIGFSLLLCYHGFKYTEESETKSAANKDHILVQWHQIMLDRIDLIKYPLMEAKIQKLGLLFKKGSQPFQNIPLRLLGNFVFSSKRNCTSKNKQLRSRLIFPLVMRRSGNGEGKRQLSEGNDVKCGLCSGCLAAQPTKPQTKQLEQFWKVQTQPRRCAWRVGGIQSTNSGLTNERSGAARRTDAISSSSLTHWASNFADLEFYYVSWWEASWLYEKTATSDSGISGCWVAC